MYYLNIQDWWKIKMYILKYYIKSNYLGFNRVYYKEFELFDDLEYFIDHNDIKNYSVYGIIDILKEVK